MAKIQIIDDDGELLENMSSILRGAGHEVRTLETTENAIQVLLNDRPDLVVLDVMFPDNPAGGFDLARRIRNTNQLKDLPVLMLTAVNQEFPMDFSANDIDPEWLPVQDLLEKPVEPACLIQHIQNLLSNQSKPDTP